MDRLEGLVEQKETALEAIKNAAEVSAAYAYGILEEARRHLDVYVGRQASRKTPPEPGEIKTVGMLFTRAYKKWNLYRGKVLSILGASDPGEIKDLEAAWKTLEELAEKEKFGGQAE